MSASLFEEQDTSQAHRVETGNRTDCPSFATRTIVNRIPQVCVKTCARSTNSKKERSINVRAVGVTDESFKCISTNETRANEATSIVNSLLTNQCQHHAAGDVSDENYDQRRDYGERDTPLRVRRLLTGGGYYVEAYEGVKTRRRAGENLTEEGEIQFFIGWNVTR